jgi:phytoene/squalene synthetase
VINHLQDCGADYRRLDRVYVPLDALARAGAPVEALAADAASPQLRQCLLSLVPSTAALLRQAEPLAVQVADWRLGLEIAVIQRLAETLTGILARRDPLRERVHLGAGAGLGVALAGIIGGLRRRLMRPAAVRARTT